jgi:D-alanyl-D-alanine carboxypeptidase
MKKRRSKKHAKRGGNALFNGLVLVSVLAIVFVGGMVWMMLTPSDEPTDSASSSSAPATTTTTLPTQQHTQMVVTSDVLNVRTGPGTGFDVQGTLAQGDEVQVLAVEGDWCRIQYKGTEAYVNAAYVALPGETTTSATTTTTKTTARTDSALLQYDTAGHYVQKAGGAWNLLLVNDWNAITADYEKSVTMVNAGNRNQKVDNRILDPLNEMLDAGKAYGIDVQSGYRSYDHQSSLYWRQVNNYKNNGYNDTAAQTAAGKVVKRPGYSEHNSGLAVDLGGSGNFSLDESFANTAAYKWLIENCADYGFILRFPKGKESITGVIYEAWHFRYVGKEAAKYIMENNLCLEEYLEQKGL